MSVQLMPRWLAASLAIAMTATVNVGCYVVAADDNPAAGPGDGSTPPGAGASSGEFSCEVAGALTACWSCHNSPPRGAPFALTKRADFTAMSATFPSQTIAQRVLARIIDNARPMPPSGLLAAAQRSPLQAWIEAGTPAESCDQGPGMPPIEPPPPGPATVVCSSGDYYQPRSGREDDGEPDMNPGLACRNCHLREKPRLAFAFMGTVFPTLHEADLCISQVPVNTEVHIVDADGVVALKLPVRRNGNFMSASAMSSVKRPFTAKVVNQNGVRQMTTPQMNGDCNGCHSEQGANGAPGRILIPQR